MAKEKEYTKAGKCVHCGNFSQKEIIGHASKLEHREQEGPNWQEEWEEGPVWDIAFCSACKNVSVREGYWHERLNDGPPEMKLLYPKPTQPLKGLPGRIQRAHEACTRVRNVDSNAFGMLVRRLIELICIEHGAKGKFLHHKLRDLASRNEIPPKLADVADKIKEFGNVGAHPELGELSPTDIPIMEKLSEALLNYLYVAPLLVLEAENALGAKKQAKKSK